MNNIVSYFVNAFNRFLGYFPKALPVGMTQFENLVQHLVATYTLPTTDIESIRFGVAACILRLGPQTTKVSNRFLVATITAGAAKQISGAQLEDIKHRQKVAQQAAAAEAFAAAQQQAEATAQPPSAVVAHVNATQAS